MGFRVLCEQLGCKNQLTSLAGCWVHGTGHPVWARGSWLRLQVLKARKARTKPTKESFPHGPQGQHPQLRVNACPRLWKQRAQGCCPAPLPCPILYTNRCEGIRSPSMRNGCVLLPPCPLQGARGRCGMLWARRVGSGFQFWGGSSGSCSEASFSRVGFFYSSLYS